MLNQARFFYADDRVATVAILGRRNWSPMHLPASQTHANAADIDLVVNICSAVILIFGLSFVTRYGVAAGLVLNPIIMVIAFIGLRCRLPCL